MANGGPEPRQDTKLKVYELYLEDLGRIGSRHETARQFYVGIITALTAFLALFGKDGNFTFLGTAMGVILSGAGVFIGVL